MDIAAYVLGKIIVQLHKLYRNTSYTAMYSNLKQGWCSSRGKNAFRGGCCGAINYAVAAKVVDSYNYLNANHGWLAGGIASLASGLILYCNSYGNIVMKI